MKRILALISEGVIRLLVIVGGFLCITAIFGFTTAYFPGFSNRFLIFLTEYQGQPVIFFIRPIPVMVFVTLIAAAFFVLVRMYGIVSSQDGILFSFKEGDDEETESPA